MSHRYDQKKAARDYRREVRKNAKKVSDLIATNLKPKPEWIPWRVWRFFLGFFIIIKK